jgi:hypothetical protein
MDKEDLEVVGFTAAMRLRDQIDESPKFTCSCCDREQPRSVLVGTAALFFNDQFMTTSQPGEMIPRTVGYSFCRFCWERHHNTPDRLAQLAEQHLRAKEAGQEPKIEPFCYPTQVELEVWRGTVQTAPLGEKVGRNEPCPCGSGKKAKKCCQT